MKSYPLVMGLFFFFKFKPKKDENEKALNKNSKLCNLIPWETGNKVEMCRCNLKVTEPNVGLYFSLNGYKCNLHFWRAQNEFPFFVHTCIDIQFERSRVEQYDPFRH